MNKIREILKDYAGRYVGSKLHRVPSRDLRIQVDKEIEKNVSLLLEIKDAIWKIKHYPNERDSILREIEEKVDRLLS